VTTGGRTEERADGRTAEVPDRTTAPPAWELMVDTRGRPGAENMAVDWALLRAAQEGSAFLRLYRWDPPCLSFGRHEPACARYDRERIAALGLATVRRPTGGRAVWHAHEVTYAVAGPTEMFGSLQEAYIAIHRLLAGALRQLGADVALAARTERPMGPGAGACFAAPVGGEIVSGGRKLVGSAQVREGRALLQHGSILLQDGQDVVSRVTRRQALPSAATSLTTVLGRPVTFTEVADAIAAQAQSTWAGPWERADVDPTPDDLRRFGDDAWTWRR
jgi:lipoate-protein ligase A